MRRPEVGSEPSGRLRAGLLATVLGSLLTAPAAGSSAPAAGLRWGPPAASTPPGESVRVPRVTGATVAIDGRLDEPVWAQAARLGGFSEYLPNDDRPADDSTTVLVWYSPTAIYFGIRAYGRSAAVRATLADRDKIGGDDYVDILLDTFDDRRQALLFGVNPLGVQADGTLRDAPRQAATVMSSAVSGAYTVDLSPDYVYESKGRLTGWGYEVEIKIPFKSLRYPARDPQDWGLNVLRMVQATGHAHTWTRVLQTRASFLAQSGRLTGLTGMSRGLVLDVTPEATSTLSGARGPAGGGWRYGGGGPQAGVTARWGITSGAALDATVRPDFSQVEADAPQIQFDPRNAIHYPEKRPFFLDGLELYQTPVQLIYTRRLVDPRGAVKLIGKFGPVTVATLSGVDGADASATGSGRPVLNAVRLRQDFAGENSVGVVYTDRVDGPLMNRVAALDAALVLGRSRAWSLSVQGGGSATRDTAGAPVRSGPFWNVRLVRAGRRFGLDLRSYAAGDDFRTEAGFISRSGYVQDVLIPSYTWAGRPGSWLESATVNATMAVAWDEYRRFAAGEVPDVPQTDLNTGFVLRGGWQAGLSASVQSYARPATLYGDYWVEVASGGAGGGAVDTVPFAGRPRILNFDWAFNVRTPQLRTFALSAYVLGGNDDDFYEWAPARIWMGNLDLLWRPTDQLRAELTYTHQQIVRRAGGSTVALIRVPRLKVEYQLSRPIFVRLIGQYASTQVDALRDVAGGGGAILIRDAATGTFTRTARTVTNDLRVDWLFSYRPTPGTVVFVGYGGTLAEPVPFRFQGLDRLNDGFFVKLSWLLRA